MRVRPGCSGSFCEDVGISRCLRAAGVRLVGVPGMCPWEPGGLNHALPLPGLRAFCADPAVQRACCAQAPGNVCNRSGVPLTFHWVTAQRRLDADLSRQGPCVLKVPCNWTQARPVPYPPID